MDDLDEAMVAAIWHSALNAYEHDGEGELDDEAAIADLMQALRALPTVSDGWQPIETAPRDGSEFLSAGGINGTAGKSYATRWLSPGPYTTENGKNTEGERRYQYPDGFYWAGYDGFVGPIDPTIWRPLPAPPSE